MQRSLQATRLTSVGTTLAASLLALACGDSGGTVSGTVTPTLIAIDPADFLDDLTCANVPGGARRYVATVTDVTPEDEDEDLGSPFTLPSSPPVACARQTAFGFVQAGRRYTAEVDIYEQGGLSPLAEGSRKMVDASGAIVEPRWTTACGRGTDDDDLSKAAISVLFATIFVQPCDPPQDRGESVTGLTVDVEPALASLSCGSEAGQVDRFRVVLGGSAEDPREASCGESVEPYIGLEAGRGYDFAVEAFEAEATEASWTTSCFAEARSGVILKAACDPLVAVEAVEANEDEATSE